MVAPPYFHKFNTGKYGEANTGGKFGDGAPVVVPRCCPGKHPLKDAHQALDAAVLAAYGFDATEDLLAQLLELNLTVAAMKKQDKKVTAPGIPPSYGDAAKLVTKDCIKP